MPVRFMNKQKFWIKSGFTIDLSKCKDASLFNVDSEEIFSNCDISYLIDTNLTNDLEKYCEKEVINVLKHEK